MVNWAFLPLPTSLAPALLGARARAEAATKIPSSQSPSEVIESSDETKRKAEEEAIAQNSDDETYRPE